MTALAVVSRAFCRISAIVFVAVMMTADVRGFECSEHSECGEGVYCIDEECTTCLSDQDVCQEGELCPWGECFCDESDGECKEGTECLNDGYPFDGLGYCGECDDVWTVCPTWPDEYYCSAGGQCLDMGMLEQCATVNDCPLDGEWVCTVWNECVRIA